ncbi:MAG: trimethylamine methyltransferase family protein [Desulfobacterales bacterium]|nr:trimethylamine methyltransferase family protein [Desulfobacterales bacterium]
MTIQQNPTNKAIWPGIAGGAYKPLSNHDIKRIHSTALDVLENIGIAHPTPELLEYALPKGCIVGDDGRLKFPRALVEDIIASTKKQIPYYGVDPKYDFEVSGESVYTGTAGEAVNILDYKTQTYRPSKLTDLYDAARMVNQLDNIHILMQPFIATEHSEDLYNHDINIAYAQLAGTAKPFTLSISQPKHIDPIISLFDTFLGKEGAFLERPFCYILGCPIRSPLAFSKNNLAVLIKTAQLGLPTDSCVASQAGATAPAALAGAMVQTFAETLAGLCVVNLVRPGMPMCFGMWPFITDLRTGNFTGGSGEEALIISAAAQLCNYYGLITSGPAGMTDSKTMDAQAGYEKGITTSTVALAGSNIISFYPGMVGSLMAQSFEGMVIDNDMLGNVLRVVRGIEVTDETLSYDVIKETVYGQGHYLDHPQTYKLMRSEFVYPEMADRRLPEEWQKDGSKTIYDRAHEKVKEMLSNYYPDHIDPAADIRIRDNFPIKLKPADMKPGNGRWDKE